MHSSCLKPWETRSLTVELFHLCPAFETDYFVVLYGVFRWDLTGFCQASENHRGLRYTEHSRNRATFQVQPSDSKIDLPKWTPQLLQVSNHQRDSGMPHKQDQDTQTVGLWVSGRRFSALS